MLLLQAFLFGSTALAAVTKTNVQRQCKATPADRASWPKPATWAALNTTVQGRLAPAIPLAAACHKSFDGIATYDASACANLTENWMTDQSLRWQSPTAAYWDFWTNNTCAPSADPDSPCTLGTLPAYVVKAKGVKDIQAAVNFARKNNVRLIIKNTGHDFNGKSTGAHSLSIWTHHLQDIDIIDNYRDPSTAYTGSAVRLGAGWLAQDIYNELHKVGKTIVAGECPTVGVTGGFISGGGHGPLSSALGLASDHVLQFQLVTASGTHITADAEQNTDLFWALRGGGAGTFGVVTSVTLKTHDTPPVSTMTLSIAAETVGADKLWQAIGQFHKHVPAWTSKGLYAYYEITSAGGLVVQPLLAPHIGLAELTAIMKPFLTDLDKMLGKEAYNHTLQTWPTWLDAYRALFTSEGAGGNMLTSSRLIQRAHVQKSSDELTAVFRRAAEIHEGAAIIIGHAVAPGVPEAGVDRNSAVNPIWKEAVMLPLYNTYLVGNETQDQLWKALGDVEEVDSEFKKLTPGSGTYLNEANAWEADWQRDFYGVNWDRLSKIKKKWDKGGVFWARQAVGSEEWVEGEGGTLCRV